MKKHFFLLVVFLFINCTYVILQSPAVVVAQPLYTNFRWIVDDSGNRVKLACVNWVSHLETMVAEGLSKQPMDVISEKITSMGFNCVRFTWPLFMVTNESLGSITVRQSFQSLGLVEDVAGIQVNNPSILDLSVIQVFQLVVSNLGDNDVMVILDNHISTPGWCCSREDGNGFFGDKYFDPDVWVEGLTRMATMFNGTTNVVAMSLRNELRGMKQNVTDWYRYMQKGAEAVHAANPNVLIILSGLNYDKDFTFLSKRPLKLTFKGKIVLEIHLYAFSDGDWGTGNANEVCGTVIKNMMWRGGFLLQQGWPIILSEFGIDQRGVNEKDNRFLNCLLGVVAELDMDWALWTLAGSYYLRQGVVGMEETYGVLSGDWSETRNQSFIQKISVLQSPLRGPGISEANPHKIIFHSSTALCIQRKSLGRALTLGSCAESEAWDYTPQKTLVLKGTYFCLQADGIGKPAKLGIICNDSNSKWEPISDSKMHLSSNLPDNTTVCLDIDPTNNDIVTTSCMCLKTYHDCDPGIQWFKIVSSTRSTSVELALPSEPHLDLIENAQLPMEFVGTKGRSSQ